MTYPITPPQRAQPTNADQRKKENCFNNFKYKQNIARYKHFTESLNLLIYFSFWVHFLIIKIHKKKKRREKSKTILENWDFSWL